MQKQQQNTLQFIITSETDFIQNNNRNNIQPQKNALFAMRSSTRTNSQPPEHPPPTHTHTHTHIHTHTHTHTPLLSSKIIRLDHPLKPSAMLKKNNNTPSFLGTSLSGTSVSGTSVSGASVSGESLSGTSVFGTAKAKTNGTDGYPRDGKTWRRRVHPSQLSVSGASACAFRLCHPSPAIQLKEIYFIVPHRANHLTTTEKWKKRTVSSACIRIRMGHICIPICARNKLKVFSYTGFYCLTCRTSHRRGHDLVYLPSSFPPVLQTADRDCQTWQPKDNKT